MICINVIVILNNNVIDYKKIQSFEKIISILWIKILFQKDQMYC